ncbi:MAG: alpha/beta hydrolase [Lacunisphaera sp.]
MNLGLCVYIPKVAGRFPALLDVHGGGWEQRQVESDKPLMERLATHGYVTALVSYRLSAVAKYPAQLYDVKTAIRFLRAHAEELQIDPAHLGLIGGSAGGQLVALAGMTNGRAEYEGPGENQQYSSAAQACIVMAATMDLYAENLAKTGHFQEAYLGYSCAERPDLFKDASPLFHVTEKAPPVVFIEGENDHKKIGRAEMMARLQSFGIETNLHVLPGAPHPFWMSQPWLDQTVDLALEFFNRRLKPVPPGR